MFSYLKDKNAVAELFREVSPKIAERPGGYTRILKTGNRIGDNADMCIFELVDFNETMLGGETAKTKTTRRRRSPKKKTENEKSAEHKPKTTRGKVKKTEKTAKKTKEVSEEPGQEEEKTD